MLTALMVVCGVAIGGPLSGPASFRGLGDVPGGALWSHASAASADGSVVVGVCWDATGQVAYRWTAADGFVILGRLRPEDVGSSAEDVSADGNVIAGYSGIEAFRWTEQTGMVGLGDLPGSNFSSGAEAISADGSTIVGVSQGANGAEAVRWTAATGLVGLGELPGGGVGSSAGAVSGDGSIIFGTSATVGMHPLCRWIGNGPIESLGVYDVENSYATDVSHDGLVVSGIGHRSQGQQEAFIWTERDGYTGLGFLPGGTDDSNAYAISGDGTIVVGRDITDVPEGDEAFVWTAATGMLNLRLWLEAEHGIELPGWTLKRALDISDDGTTIVGYGVDPCGHTQAWMVRLAPPLLEQPAPCAGDVNGDRAVDFTDLNDLLSRFNQEAICGDLNGDGVVGFSDLNVLLSSYSNGCP